MTHVAFQDPNHRTADTSGIAQVGCTASTAKDHWRTGEPPDLAALLVQCPELKDNRSVVLDLAYKEYRRRLRAGETIDPAEFVARFPSLGRSLYKLIVFKSLLGSDPEAEERRTLEWPAPGSQFLGFNLIREIGRGAFGRVFLAAERALGERPVVLKVALQGGQEAEMLARLRHPNIVPVYSTGHDDATGLAGICMPYLGQATLSVVIDAVFAQASVHGPPKSPFAPRKWRYFRGAKGDLSAKIPGRLTAVRERLPAQRQAPAQARVICEAIQAANVGLASPEPGAPPRILLEGSYIEGVIHLAAEIADGLAHAHRCGICHRDLKPSNILLSPTGRPLLLDFNLAVEDHLPVWKIGGTLPYMAPEELVKVCEKPARAAALSYHPSSDLFSLGVIVYELLTGSLPFGTVACDASVEETARAVLQRQAQGPPSIRRLNHQVDKRLARLIEGCLAFDVERRPKDPGELAAALRGELASPRRMRRWAVAHRWRVAVAAAGLSAVLLAAVAGVVLWPPYSARQFQSGLAYYQAGKDDLAIQCLNASIQADPGRSEAFLARARARQRRGDFRLAFDDYQAANQLAPSPWIDAWMGYCMSRLGEHKKAVAYYRTALDAGCDSSALLNDLGHGLIQLGRFDDAEGFLRRATGRGDSPQAAYHNLAIVLLDRAMETGEAPPPEAVACAARAAEIGPESDDLCQHIADLQSLAAKRDPALRQSAVENVRKAIALGMDVEVLRSDPALQVLQNDPAFQVALAEPNRAAAALTADYLVAP